MSRCCLSLEEKINLLNDLKNGASQASLIEKYKVSKSTICRVARCENEIRRQTNRHRDSKYISTIPKPRKDELNCCRACLQLLGGATGDTFDLFTTPKLAQKFSACTTLVVSTDYKVSTELCLSCYNKVLDFYKFQKMCIDADKRARKISRANCFPVSENGDADEKPVFDLEAQDVEEIIISESKLLVADGLVDYVDSAKTAKLDEHSQSLKLTKNEIPCELPLSNVNDDIIDDDNGIDTDCSETSSTHRRASNKQSDGSVLPALFYQCDLCPKRFFVEHRLVAHKREHDGLVPYPCPEADCDKGFNRKDCLTEHLKQHAGTLSVYTCNQPGCEKAYKHKTTLVMHLRRIHQMGPELKTAICEICGKVLKTAAILRDHRYTHKSKSELPYACKESNCPQRFSTREKLKVHTLRHAGIKNFTCPYCGMRKTTRNELKIHMNYHTLERTWPCAYCAKVCNSAGNLRMHVRTVHERARDYACQYCERTFAKPDTRKYHEMTHTGEKPHECQQCGKRFTQPAALRTHKKVHQKQRNDLNAIHDECEPSATPAPVQEQQESILLIT